MRRGMGRGFFSFFQKEKEMYNNKKKSSKFYYSCLGVAINAQFSKLVTEST